MPDAPDQQSDDGLFNSLPTAIAEVDLWGNILRANHNLAQLTRIPKAQLLTANLFSITTGGLPAEEIDRLISELRCGKRHYLSFERQIKPINNAPIADNQTADSNDYILAAAGSNRPASAPEGIAPKENQLWVKIKLQTAKSEGEAPPDKALAIIEDIPVPKSQPATPADERQQFFYQTFYSNIAPKLLIDPADGHIADANNAAESLYGYSREELRHMHIQQINTLSAAQISAEMAQAEAENRLYFRFRHRVRSGEIKDVEVFSGPVWIAGHRLLYSIIHDVTLARNYQRRLEIYRRLFHTVPVGIFRSTPEPNGTFLEINPAMVEIFEADSDAELLATPVSDLYVTPGKRTEISTRLNSAGTISGLEVQLRTLRGNYIWARLSIRKNLDEDGHTIFDGLVEDITERVAAERFQHKLLHSLAEGVMGTDSAGKITFLNPAACKLLGYAAEHEALGLDSHSTSHHTKPDGSPFPHTECPIYRVTQTGVPLEAWEDLFWRTDGHSFPVLVYAAPIHSEDGTRGGAVVSFQDITERQRAQRERDRMLAILDEHPHFIQRFLPDGTIVFVNRALSDLLGKPVKEIVGGKLLDAVPEQEQEPLHINLAAFTPGNAARHIEHPLIDARGNQRWIEWNTRGFFTKNGNLTHFQSVGVDITERKAAEQARRQAEEDRNTFFASVSHDLRTPLNAILGFTELLKRTPLDETQSHYIELCKTAGDRLLSLIETLLDLSRLEAGRLTLNQTPFELRSFMAKHVELLRERATNKGLELTLDIEPDLPQWVYGDATRFAQVVCNLTINAIKFTDQGEVAIALRSANPGYVTVSVSDTGPGIPPNQRERIFEAFIQAGDERQRQGGSGLGLKICRELVYIMGGELKLESAQDQGSRFFFTIQLPGAADDIVAATQNRVGPERERPNYTCQQRSVAQQAAGAEAGDTAPSKDIRVLIAEDEPVNALLARKVLENAGCHVLEAGNGKQAVEIWQQESLDLILLDVQMPVMDGPTAAARIRQLESEQGRPRVTIAALTAHAIEDVQEQCRSMGCDDYLTKPLDINAIEALLYQIRQDRP